MAETKVDPKVLARAKQLWEQFPPEAQDCTFEWFLQEFISMSDPQKIQQDLERIQMAREIQNGTKSKIDQALARARKNE